MGIFRLASNCGEDLLSTKCKWSINAQGYFRKVKQVSAHAFFLQQVLTDMAVDCSDASGDFWPFSQQCSKDKCGFKYGLAISAMDRNNKLSQLPQNLWFEFGEWFLYPECIKQCDVNFRENGAAYFNTFAYSGDGKLYKGSCSEICSKANNLGNIVLGSIPNLCIQTEHCEKDIKYDELWGFGL